MIDVKNGCIELVVDVDFTLLRYCCCCSPELIMSCHFNEYAALFLGLHNILDSLFSVIGSFFDWTQSYDLAFYFTGCCLVVGGAVPFLTAFLCRNPVNNKKNVLGDLDGDHDPE